MQDKVLKLYARLRRTPFPALGKQVGDFPLYDGLLAGFADRASRGEPVSATEIPVPDNETARRVAELRGKGALSQEEQAFLQCIRSGLRLRGWGHER